MKKQKRFILFGLTLIAMLLFAAVPTAARSEGKPFEAVVVLCGYGEAAREWYETTDDGETIWHFRNMIYQSYHYSQDERMHGIATWRGNQDLNIDTFTGRAWGTGVIETAEGTWHVVYKGAFESGVGGSEGKGHGRDGLESLKMHYTGSIIQEMPEDIENPCAPTDIPTVMTFEGMIIDPKGD